MRRKIRPEYVRAEEPVCGGLQYGSTCGRADVCVPRGLL